MGKPLMIREADDERIESLKKRLRIESKIGAVRAGIDLLEKETPSRTWREGHGFLPCRTSEGMSLSL